MAILTSGCGCFSRRSFLSGAAALACVGEAVAQPAAFRIDVHHHVVPPRLSHDDQPAHARIAADEELVGAQFS